MCFGHRKGKSTPVRNWSVCPRKEEGEQVDARNWRRDAEAAVTCVGGDGCSMPAALALAIFCRFVGSMAGGEAWEDAGAWERWTATPARCSGEPKVGNHLLERLLRFFSSRKGVFVGEVSHWIAKLASPAWGWDPQPRHPRLLGRWDATLGWAAPAGTCYVAGAGKRSYNLIPAATLLFF